MNNALTDKVKTFFSKLKGGKKLQYIFVFFLCAVLVFMLCFNFTDNSASSDKNTDLVSAYVKDLESRLSDTLSKVEGAGEVAVVITVESGMETVLAKKVIKTETSNGVEIEETPITVNGKTVVLKELYPKIVGVLIVAQGANKISVLNKIQQATVSLLDIELNQIEILTMK